VSQRPVGWLVDAGERRIVLRSFGAFDDVTFTETASLLSRLAVFLFSLAEFAP